MGRSICREELLSSNLQKVLDSCGFTKGHKAIVTMWVYINKKDEWGLSSKKSKTSCSRKYQRRGPWTMMSLCTCGLFLTEKKAFFSSQDINVNEILRKIYDRFFDVLKPQADIHCLPFLLHFFSLSCVRFQVSPKTSHLLVVKRIFRYLKGKPSLGLWYSKDSPLELVAYTDSDYAGATQDRKSTTRGSLDTKPNVDMDLLIKGFDAVRFSVLGLKYWNAKSLMPSLDNNEVVEMVTQMMHYLRGRNVVCSDVLVLAPHNKWSSVNMSY
ncbi:hypothetical protein Tco_0674106 [Tanacetum coccineum]